MEIFTLDNDIKVFCETAISFPEGIMKAHKELQSIVPFSEERRYFGISRPNEKGVVIYKAATEEIYQGEAEELGYIIQPFKKTATYSEINIIDF